MRASIDGDFPVRIVAASWPGGLVDLHIKGGLDDHRIRMTPANAEELARSILAAVELARSEPEGKGCP